MYEKKIKIDNQINRFREKEGEEVEKGGKNETKNR